MTCYHIPDRLLPVEARERTVKTLADKKTPRGRKIRADERASERITVLLTPTEYKALKDYAESEQRTVAYVLREALHEVVKEIEPIK